jgi:AsmA family protein
MVDATSPHTDAGAASAPRGGMRFKRWQAVLLGIVAAIAVLFMVFDWDWFRKPLQNYITEKTGREFRMSHLDVALGFPPTIKMRDVYFANADWSKVGDPMARIASLEFTVSLRDLFERKILVPRAALSGADLLLERSADERKNWVLKAPEDSRQTGTFRISSISVDKGRLRFQDHGEPFEVDVNASTFEPTATAKVTQADAKASNTSYTTRYDFKGKYKGAAFTGDALTGDVLSFQESDIPFPIKGNLRASTTRVSVEGTVADLVNISAIDVKLQIAGDTLASLYPFLLLPLPASPAYDFQGRLQQKGNRYAIEDLRGKIGSTDIAGSGAYVKQQPRPLLTAKLNSRLLNIADLGPIIGVETRSGKGAAGASSATPATARKTSPPRQQDTATRAAAQARERQTNGEKILPTGASAAKGDGVLPRGRFEGGRLKAIDAQIDYTAARLKAPSALPVENMKFSFKLNNAVATLQPLEFGFAGGRIVSDITIDARQEKTLRSIFNVDLRGIQVAKLFPDKPSVAKGAGQFGGQVRLSGSGNSIADVAASANGTVGAAISNGRVSNLMDAIAGLNGGKIISLFVGGDKDIAIHCGGAAFAVKDGIGTSQLFAVDTEQTRIDGTGTVNFKNETLNLTVEPKPKKPGILSLRTPVYVTGTFRHPQASLDKTQIALRAGGAVALALINPLAALLPLIETGPGKDTNCGKVLAPVRGSEQQAVTRGNALPKRAPSQAPIKP